jgi:hypothetical protein
MLYASVKNQFKNSAEHLKTLQTSNRKQKVKTVDRCGPNHKQGERSARLSAGIPLMEKINNLPPVNWNTAQKQCLNIRHCLWVFADGPRV